ncbi:hypothetical protein NL676_015022 [Syzygium grande]|nr:hypothetical protein NL676_015022 [Syzygium grande]
MAPRQLPLSRKGKRGSYPITRGKAGAAQKQRTALLPREGEVMTVGFTSEGCLTCSSRWKETPQCREISGACERGDGIRRTSESDRETVEASDGCKGLVARAKRRRCESRVVLRRLLGQKKSPVFTVNRTVCGQVLGRVPKAPLLCSALLMAVTGTANLFSI